MPEQISHEHHYVPRWYQKRFLAPGQQKLWNLDLKPDNVKLDGHRSFTHNAIRRLYPGERFWLMDMYLLQFEKHITDIIEKRFFGVVDVNGQKSAQFFAVPEINRDGLNQAYNGLLQYMAAQRFRTPRALDWLKKQTGVQDKNQILLTMREMFDAYNAMWMEGTWEIESARKTTAKFIITDDPVTFFNRKIYPPEIAYPGGDDFPKVGTRTIFPLGPDYCLIITHLQLIRNPWCKPLETRVNARLHGTTIGYLVGIQSCRELDEIDVSRINYIMKSRATTYIAAGRKEDLNPENQLAKVDWAKLDDDWFLLPNVWKVHFRTGLMVGSKRGRPLSIDEYGRNPRDPSFKNEERRRKEHITFEAGKLEWARKRRGKPFAQTLDVGNENTLYDKWVRECWQKQDMGLTGAWTDSDED